MSTSPPSPPTFTASDTSASASAPTRLRGLLALIVVVLMMAVSGFFLATKKWAVESAGDAEALNLAGRQALLAERLSAQALGIASGEDNLLPLDETLTQMMSDAVRLHELRGVWGGTEDDPNHWTARRERLWAAAQALQMARERGEPHLTTYLARVLREERQFVATMEQAASELQKLAESRQHQTLQKQVMLVALLTLGVATVLWGLGEPLARRIARHHARLMAQAKQLERLAMVADRTQNGVVITDAQGLLVWANQGFTRITGFTPEEGRGREPASFLQFERTDRATSEALEHAQRAAEPVRVEILNRGKHGRSFWVDLDIQPLRDAAGALTGFIQVTTDITAQVERREYLDAILRALPAGLIVQDPEGFIVDANLKAEQLLGIPRDQLVGRSPTDSHWPSLGEDGAPIANADLPSMSTLRTGMPHEDCAVGVPTPSGHRRWLRVNTQILPGPDGSTQGVVSCFLDETEVRAQRNLLQTTIDGAGVGTWDWDMATGRIDYNERWAIMFGFEVGEVPHQFGAWQDLVHPDDALPARHALHAHLADAAVPYRAEFRMRTKRGGWTWVLAAGSVIERGPDGRGSRMVGVMVDINDRKRLEQALSDAALTDSLTQLPNRASIQRALARCVAKASNGSGEVFAVLFMDFDRFKLVNDSLGHDAGDELLRQIAQRVKRVLRPGDDVARLTGPIEMGDVAGRLGGDEFVVLLERVARPADATRVAQRLLEALAAPYTLAGRRVQSTVSIGIVTSDVSSADVESVLRDADTAMYEAKRLGRGRYEVFRPEMHHRIRHAVELEADLRLALQRNECFVVYQPIVELPSRRPIGLEALVRWRHPVRGLVSPADFVPLAEEAGLIDSLGEQVLRRACADLAAWRHRLGEFAPRTVAVNLSRAQLRPKQLAAMVRTALDDAALPPEALRLEITETMAMQDEAALGVLGELRAMGVRLALDDFGTGYSSLASPDQLPIDTVKIDQSFVAKMAPGSYQAALVQSTVQVAEALSLQVIAEGVETEAQAEALAALGCVAAQGFLFGRPMGADELLSWWVQRQPAWDVVDALPA